MTITDLAPQRRHTLYFLRETRAFAPVFLDTEVDMSRVAALRSGHRHSVVTYVLYAAGRVLARHPEANAAILDGRRPKVVRHDAVHGKLTLDKTLDGHRVVLATVLRDLERLDLDEIQRQVERFRTGDPASMPEFAGVRALHRAGPGRRGWRRAERAFRRVVRPLESRAAIWGTVAVTSLGHGVVDGFHSVGGTTVTLGLGRTVERPVVRDGRIVVAPVMRLSLAFDHRVIDGAEAADVLADIRETLQTFPEPANPGQPDPPAREQSGRAAPEPEAAAVTTATVEGPR
ncbi:2-oxo acid dehydrogenase subunit E2 [Frankia sp. AgPm24]|uniref:2-oxo acid dehydrogenase subunit E2 n=1 Tax=Frankia umida TaxID=573489 RepID=A0ABT0K3Z9_9ACTN|nr:MULTISPECIES: 2-oxo acid dehydrogenase subunit E2 [Frankia]MCK9878043.1 2-oxo acid dehydrogenase subunit E2 [Frankia umida]MCK9922405.1 2-oxo acid dehydrogenase subunit E2 [Frankia sp. AgPm24]